MDKIQWIKDLVLAEQNMEESGIVDVSTGFDPARQIEEATVEFLKDLKTAFIENASAFNQLKGSTIGTIKIYGISQTVADFMLFRNGYKLIFSMKQPGAIQVRFNSMGDQFFKATQPSHQSESSDLLKASVGAFGKLDWSYDGKMINLDYLIRFYLTRFIKESAK